MTTPCARIPSEENVVPLAPYLQPELQRLDRTILADNLPQRRQRPGGREVEILALRQVAQLSGIVLLILAGGWPEISDTRTGESPIEVGKTGTITLDW